MSMQLTLIISREKRDLISLRNSWLLLMDLKSFLLPVLEGGLFLEGIIIRQHFLVCLHLRWIIVKEL